MHPLVNIAVSAARKAGNFIARYADRIEDLRISTKSRNDFVSEVDRRAEALIVDTIRRAYPQHAILAEESGAQQGDDDSVRWIVDPLDGTTNFLHRIPHFAVSIGVEVRGRLEHGVIYAPPTQDLYIASHGSGAQLNSRRIRVSGRLDTDSALIGTGIPTRADALEAYVPMLGRVAEDTAGIRRAGAASLDLAYVAAGRLDGFWELGLKPWDIAAGLVLVQEAGGLLSGVCADDSDDDLLAHGNVVAATPRLHPWLLERLRRAAPKPA
ncbi:MAG TPA: inositol monophosphatase family protein [Nevskiaceae bacterium]